MSETWLINEVPTIEPLALDENIQIYNANFTSNGRTFQNIGLSNEMVPGKPTNLANIQYDTGLSTTTPAYNSGRWENEAYRTITFETEPTGDLLAWLQANGTKQATPVTKQQIDLSKLSGWASLASGSHQITIKTKANGYADSAASNAVSVEKAASGYTVNFSNDLGDDLPSYGKFEYSLDGSTWNTILEWHSNDGTKPPLQVTTLSGVSTIKFKITGAAAEPGFYLSMVGGVVGSTTKLFSIETAYSSSTDPVATTDMLTLEDNINVSISSRFSIG